MFLKRKKKSADKSEEVLNKASFETVKNALESILKCEYRVQVVGEGGPHEVVDYEMTARMMKAQARIALDHVKNIDNEKEN